MDVLPQRDLPDDAVRSAVEVQDEAMPQAGWSGEPSTSGWQLVTGHSKGQILIWDPHQGPIRSIAQLGCPGHPIRLVSSSRLVGVLYCRSVAAKLFAVFCGAPAPGCCALVSMYASIQ
jgi:hypothetical protein